MKTMTRTLAFILLALSLFALLSACGETEGSCTVAIYVDGKAVLSDYKFTYTDSATVLDALTAAAKDGLKETVKELKNDRGTVLSFVSLQDRTTALSEDGKTLSYWGYSMTDAAGNALAVPAQQQIKDGATVTFTYHTITLPKSKDAIPVSVSLTFVNANKEASYDRDVEIANVTPLLALEELTADTKIKEEYKTVLTAVAAAIKEGKTELTAEDTVWTWHITAVDKKGKDKELTNYKEDELKAGDVLTVTVTGQPVAPPDPAPEGDENTDGEGQQA